MKSFKEFSKEVSEQKQIPYCRDTFVRGKLFKVGDLVESSFGQAEILSVGTNYVTLIHDGKTRKVWPDDIKLVESARTVYPPTKTFNGSLNFRGYITKKFSSDITDIFINRFDESCDVYAFYNCVRLCDTLFKASPNSLIEGYDKYSEEYQKASKYLDSFGISLTKINLIGEALDIIKKEIK